MRVVDRSADVLVSEQIGRTRYRTPDGYLYCEGVRISRVADMLYRDFEIPELQPRDGVVVMQRPAETLFSSETIASFQGKDVTYDHPENLLDPDSWREHTVGTVLNPRRGEGIDADYLVADLLLKDARAIRDVESGELREVSCGYDGDRVQVMPGVGKFTRMIGNHVALVDKGRCGPTCAISDKDKSKMKTSPMTRIRNAFKAKDEAALDAALTEIGGDTSIAGATLDAGHPGITINVNGGRATKDADDETEEERKAREEKEAKDAEAEEEKAKEAKDSLAKILAAITDQGNSLKALGDRIAKLETKDGEETEEERKAREEKEAKDAAAEEEERKKKEDGEDKKAMDAATVAVVRREFADVVSKAEIIAPGVKLPQFDARASRKTMADAMCGLRKLALEKALADSARCGNVKAVLGDKPTLDGMSCDAMALAFNGVAALARAAANAPRTAALDGMSGKVTTAADLQRINEAHRARNAPKRA